ncbi:MAG: rod-binding protein [Buchnera aphidicola (Melaphis rhois)]
MNNDFYFSMNSYLNCKNVNQLQCSKQKNKNDTYNSQVAKQVEGLFLYIMLKSMRNSFPKDTLINRSQEHIYEDIYDQFITQEISKKGLGLSKMIEKQIQQSTEIITK